MRVWGARPHLFASTQESSNAPQTNKEVKATGKATENGNDLEDSSYGLNHARAPAIYSYLSDSIGSRFAAFHAG